ncbi:MAG: hypothetical protein DCF22_22615 [Leptolyngbya sp.]|nr:MAG: hypothetical protein DCF22_22615 [Leptolyngbya sp.]
MITALVFKIIPIGKIADSRRFIGLKGVPQRIETVNYALKLFESILRTVFETEAETPILPLAFDLPEEAKTRILPLAI